MEKGKQTYKLPSPQWANSAYNDFRDFPSVQWKLLNVNKLKIQNPVKHRQEVERLKAHLGMIK